MKKARHYNVGTECYALLMPDYDPEFMMPVKIMILGKYAQKTKIFYKVKIKDILETDFDYIKEHVSNLRYPSKSKEEPKSLIWKTDVEKMTNLQELVIYVKNKPFMLEDNYITLDRMSLKDLYHRFTKYIINFHFRKLYQMMNRRFIYDTPIYVGDVDKFLKRVDKQGFGDMFREYELKLDI